MTALGDRVDLMTESLNNTTGKLLNLQSNLGHHIKKFGAADSSITKRMNAFIETATKRFDVIASPLGRNARWSVVDVTGRPPVINEVGDADTDTDDVGTPNADVGHGPSAAGRDAGDRSLPTSTSAASNDDADVGRRPSVARNDACDRSFPTSTPTSRRASTDPDGLVLPADVYTEWTLWLRD